MTHKEALSIILHREIENLLTEIDDDVEKLFNNSTSITLPVSLHQDMINSILLEAYLKNLESGDGKNFALKLIKNGARG